MLFDSNSWLFPIVQSVHVAGIAMMVGTIILVDLRIFGIGMRRRSVPELALELAPWTRLGLAIILITGPALFLADTARYRSNAAFLFKMAVLALALTSHFTAHRRHTRVAAALSMALWTGVVLGGRGIIDFDA